jgi:c-di-GMP-binding flagellar brake protein YcgR
MSSQMAQKARGSEYQGSHNFRHERRANPRYRLSTPPEAEIFMAGYGKPLSVNLLDISRGGCFVETKHECPVETEISVTLRKSGDRLQAMARVARLEPGKGLALQFISMEREVFQLLDNWLSQFVTAAWAAANRRKAQRVAMQIKVSVSGYNSEGERFAEDTKTIAISAFGCQVLLRNPVKKGQRLVLSNAQTKKTAEFLVVHQEWKGAESNIGLAFTGPSHSFWPVEFPPVDWSPHHQDTK